MSVTNPLWTQTEQVVRLSDICGAVGLVAPAAVTGRSPMPLAVDHLSRPVTGICQVTFTGGPEHVQPGWIAVAEIPTDAEDRDVRGLVRSLAQRGACALVVQVEREVPHALLDEASFTELPLLCLPGETTPASLIRAVHQSTSSAEVALLHRVLAIQTTLIGALAASDPPTEMVQRLGQQLGLSVVLYDHRKVVLACHGEAPVHLIANGLDDPSLGDQRMVGRWRVHLETIEVDTGRLWLALASQDDQGPGADLARSARQAVEQLLRAHARTVAAGRAQDQVQRAQILAELLDGITESRLARLRDRLVLLQFNSEGSFVVHLVSGEQGAGLDQPGLSMDHTLTAAQDLAEDLGIGILVGRHGDNRVILHPVHEQFSRALITSIPRAVHGASSAFSDLTATRTALRQAEMSQATSRRAEAFMPFHRVGFIDFVLGHVPQDTLAEKAREVLGDLEDAGALIETVVEYLRHDLDIAATCQALHVHPNSIRYRLKRVEDRLGRSLTDPETITLLYLTLHTEIRGQRPRPGRRQTRASA